MITPYAHLPRLDSVSPGTASELIYLSQHVLGVIDRALKPDGYNLGMNLGEIAGAGVPGHVHQHVVPRWAGDTNFMPAVGETKVMSETLERTYDKLRAAWEPT
jgi:ATP adenylyltransferase